MKLSEFTILEPFTITLSIVDNPLIYMKLFPLIFDLSTIISFTLVPSVYINYVAAIVVVALYSEIFLIVAVLSP
jgi:hypothetical protein